MFGFTTTKEQAALDAQQLLDDAATEATRVLAEARTKAAALLQEQKDADWLSLADAREILADPDHSRLIKAAQAVVDKAKK